MIKAIFNLEPWCCIIKKYWHLQERTEIRSDYQALLKFLHVISNNPILTAMKYCNKYNLYWLNKREFVTQLYLSVSVYFKWTIICMHQKLNNNTWNFVSSINSEIFTYIYQSFLQNCRKESLILVLCYLAKGHLETRLSMFSLDIIDIRCCCLSIT